MASVRRTVPAALFVLALGTGCIGAGEPELEISNRRWSSWNVDEGPARPSGRVIRLAPGESYRGSGWSVVRDRFGSGFEVHAGEGMRFSGGSDSGEDSTGLSVGESVTLETCTKDGGTVVSLRARAARSR